MMAKQTTGGNQVIANIGLFHVCYELSRRGFNVVPTSRNTRAVDVIVGSADFSKHATMQVKTSATDMGIHIGYKTHEKSKKLYPTLADALKETSLADFWVYVRVDKENDYAVKCVFVWRGDDEQLVREMSNDYWYEPFGKAKAIPQAMKDKWINRKDESGWQLIESALK